MTISENYAFETMLATLERVRDEMEASGGWDGDEECFQAIVDAIRIAQKE